MNTLTPLRVVRGQSVPSVTHVNKMNVGNSYTNAIKPLGLIDTKSTRMKLCFAQHYFVKKSYTEFHIKPNKGLVTTDGQTYVSSTQG